MGISDLRTHIRIVPTPSGTFLRANFGPRLVLPPSRGLSCVVRHEPMKTSASPLGLGATRASWKYRYLTAFSGTPILAFCHRWIDQGLIFHLLDGELAYTG